MKCVIGLTVLAGALSLEAAVKLGSPFADGMVLQREKPVAVWGTADAGEEVTVSFAGQSAKAKAGADGKWLVRLAPLAASAESRVLRANDAVVKSEVKDTEGAGHEELGLWLVWQGVNAVICGGIGPGAMGALAGAGIPAVAGVEGSADDAVAKLIAGTLVTASEPTCGGHAHGGCGGHCGGCHGCHH